MPPRDTRFQQADQLAGTMFNVFPQGVGDRLSGAAQAVGQAIGSTMNRFSNPVGTLISDVNAARQAISGTPLIGRRQPMQDATAATTPVLPSGALMGGFDIYPTTPQSIPQAASTAASQPSNPLVSPSVPTFPAASIGLMGNENIGPLPTEQFAAMGRVAPTLADRGNMTTDIAGMRGKTPVQTPYGTIYATPNQEAAAQRLAEAGPMAARLANVRQEMNQAERIAQMRQKGAQLGRDAINRQEQFFAQKRGEFKALNEAERIARAGGATTMDVMRARGATQPSSIAGIQRQFASYQPKVGPAAPSETIAANAVSAFNKNLSSRGFRLPQQSAGIAYAGGPQPTTSFGTPFGGFMSSGFMPSFASSPTTTNESSPMSPYLNLNRPSISDSPTAWNMWRQQFDPFIRSQQNWLQRNMDRITS